MPEDRASNETAETGDNASAERQLFGEKRDERTLFVGSELGVTRVDVAAARVGQFSLVERCSVRSLAAASGLVVVGTDETVLASTGDGFESVGFGPAVAVGTDGSWLYAAGQDGRLSRLDRDALGTAAPAWEPLGHAAGPRRFDGDLLASGAGVYRAGAPPEPLGLADVNDVAAGPFAATPSGVFGYQGGEWVLEQEGAATAIAADGDAVHALVDGRLFERTDGEWRERELPGECQPRFLAHCETLAVLCADGTLSVAADPETSHDGHGGWRSQALGVREPTALALAE